jgi:hypothetical protein
MNVKHLVFVAVLFFCSTGVSAMRTTVTVHTDRYPSRWVAPVYVPTYYPVYSYPTYSYAYWPATYTYDDFYYDYNFDSPVSALGKAFAIMGVAGLAVVLIDAIISR